MSHRSGSLESLRKLNRLRVVDALRRHGTLSRSDIAKVTGPSRSKISTLVADLHESGFVAERNGLDETRAPVVGRPPVMLRLDPPAGIAVGIDFDHTRVQVAVSDLSRAVLSEGAAELDVDHDAAGALEVAGELVVESLDRAGFSADMVLAVGVALPGPVDASHHRLHDSAILEGWMGVDVAADLRLPLARIVDLAHAGDADCRAAIAEAGRLTGVVLPDVCNLLNPEIVVVGGELSGAGQWLLEPLRTALLGRALPATTRDLRVVGGELGDRANCLGALAPAISRSEQAIAARIRASRRT